MNDVVELARALVRTPSPVVNGDERAVCALLQDRLEDAGLPRPVIVAKDPTRPNLVMTVDFGPGGSALVLCGHVDTKPVGDATWELDPFAADIEGDRLYGLGSGDMKGAVAAMVVTAERLLADPPSAGSLTLLLTADEEDGAVFGSQYLAEVLELRADGMIIGEPGGIEEDYDRLHLSSRGLGRFEVTAHGRQGHSSLSALLGLRNAGADVAAAVTRLHGLELSVPPGPSGVGDWTATVNAGLAYRGGWGYGVLPDHVAALVEVRSLPGMPREQVLAELRVAVDGVAPGANIEVLPDGSESSWIDAVPPADTDGALVAACRGATTRVFGRELPTSVFPGTTDASWLKELGIPCLPALGPGLISRAHGPDEWVSVDALRKTVDLYELLARDFCVHPGGLR